MIDDTIILGAGAFSHAHIRCMLELGILKCTIAKHSEWTSEQKNKFIQDYPSMAFTFDNNPDTTDKNVHIVTPSNKHAQLLYRNNQSAKKIFVEKPSVLYNNHDDFDYANAVNGTIYQNDWLAQVQMHRTCKDKPSVVSFTYDVKNKNEIDHITEIWSHVINFISIWIEPNCKIITHSQKYKNRTSSISCIINDELELNINSTNGFEEKSKWHLRVDNDEFNSEQFGGDLLINTLSTMLTSKEPLTDWYKSSWLIHRFRLLSSKEIFDSQFSLNYRK